MTTEELIEQLNVEDGVSDDINAGLRTGADGEKYVVIYTPDDVEMLAVPTNATNWLDVHYNWYTSSDDIAAPAREIISSLISQYLNTPISERKPEKKYTVLAIRGTDDNYLVLDPSYEPSFGPLSLHKDYDYQVSFTKKQIDRMKELGTIAIDWDKAVVKEAKGNAY